jgi:hypothetical protein
MLFWRTNVAGRVIEGTDRLRYDEHGKIAEIRVLIRPLVDIAVFASAIGLPLAARRSPVRGVLARLLMLPLKGVLTVADTVAFRLIKLHRSSPHTAGARRGGADEPHRASQLRSGT